eukprot:2908763-Rhodomonas_salina.5
MHSHTMTVARHSCQQGGARQEYCWCSSAKSQCSTAEKSLPGRTTSPPRTQAEGTLHTGESVRPEWRLMDSMPPCCWQHIPPSQGMPQSLDAAQSGR